MSDKDTAQQQREDRLKLDLWDELAQKLNESLEMLSTMEFDRRIELIQSGRSLLKRARFYEDIKEINERLSAAEVEGVQ